MNDADRKTLDDKDIELIERTSPFRGFFRLDKLRLRHARYGGGKTEPFEREVFVRPDAVCVLLYDPCADAVVLLEQFRVGPLAHGHDNPFIASLVAGMFEPGEDPIEAAKRETLEEAGIVLEGPIEKIIEYYTSPGGCTERIHVYCASVDSSKAGGIHGLDSEHEDIRVAVVPYDEATTFMNAGRTAASDVAIGLLWLANHRERLRREWR